jgi:hypothetical protein
MLETLDMGEVVKDLQKDLVPVHCHVRSLHRLLMLLLWHAPLTMDRESHLAVRGHRLGCVEISHKDA